MYWPVSAQSSFAANGARRRPQPVYVATGTCTSSVRTPDKSLPSASVLGTRIVKDWPGIGRLGSTVLSSTSTGLYQPVYVTPGIAGNCPACGSVDTRVPAATLP